MSVLGVIKIKLLALGFSTSIKPTHFLLFVLFMYTYQCNVRMQKFQFGILYCGILTNVYAVQQFDDICIRSGSICNSQKIKK